MARSLMTERMLLLVRTRLQVIRRNVRLLRSKGATGNGVNPLMGRCAFIMVVLVPLAACGNRPARSPVSVSDSAGVVIVESTAPRWGSSGGWAVDPAVLLDLATSGSGGWHEFHRVRDATRLADGSIAVADGGSNEIRVFSAAGEFSISIGREGAGPGEFRALSSVDRFGDDSLLAFDPGLQRLTVASIDGTSLRVLRPHPADLRLASVLPLTDSSFVVVTRERGSDASDGSVRRGSLSLLRLSASSGVPIDTITSMPGNESVAYSSGGFVAAIAPLFPKASHIGVVRGDVVIGTADSLEYRVLSEDGRLRRIVRVPGFELDVSAAEVEEGRAARLAGASGMPEMFRDGLERLPRPATRPAYSSLKVDTEACLWLAQYKLPSQVDEPTTWEVFSESGEWLGKVHTPSRFTVYEIGADYVLGLWRDELDVEHVQLLGLDRH
jgi:hypothetical protein